MQGMPEFTQFPSNWWCGFVVWRCSGSGFPFLQKNQRFKPPNHQLEADFSWKNCRSPGPSSVFSSFSSVFFRGKKPELALAKLSATFFVAFEHHRLEKPIYLDPQTTFSRSSSSALSHPFYGWEGSNLLKNRLQRKGYPYRHFGSTATCLRELCPQGFARHPCAGEASTKQLAMLQHRSLLQRGGPCPTRICWQLLGWCVLRSGVTFICVMAIYLIQVGNFFFFEVTALAFLHDVVLLWGFPLATLRVSGQSPGVYLVGQATSLLDCANLCSFCGSSDSVQTYSGAGSPLIADSRCDFFCPSCGTLATSSAVTLRCSLRVLFARVRASSTRRLSFLRLSSILRGTIIPSCLACANPCFGDWLCLGIAPFSERLPVKVLRCASLLVDAWSWPALRGALCGPVVPNLPGGLRILSCALRTIWFSELWAFLVAPFRGVATGMLQSFSVVTVCSWSLVSPQGRCPVSRPIWAFLPVVGRHAQLTCATDRGSAMCQKGTLILTSLLEDLVGAIAAFFEECLWTPGI